MTAAPIPLAGVDADRRAVLLEIVDRALGPHAHEATITVEVYARDIAHCSRATAYEAVKRGDVASMRVAGRIVIPVPAIAVQLLGVETNREADMTKTPLTNGRPVLASAHRTAADERTDSA